MENRKILDHQEFKKHVDNGTIADLSYNEYEAYITFIEAREHSTSLVEKTMTPYELYKLGSPAWANGLSIEQISNMMNYRQHAESKNAVDKFDRHFDQIIAHSHHFLTGITFLELIGL